MYVSPWDNKLDTFPAVKLKNKKEAASKDSTLEAATREEPDIAEMEDLSAKLTKTFIKYFPDAYVEIKPTKIVGMVILVQFALVPKEFWSGGYFENALGRLKSIITYSGGGKYSIYKGTRFSLSINPEKGSYNVMGRILGRAMSSAPGEPAKIVKTFDAALKKFKETVKENEANIYKRANYPDKYFDLSSMEIAAPARPQWLQDMMTERDTLAWKSQESIDQLYEIVEKRGYKPDGARKKTFPQAAQHIAKQLGKTKTRHLFVTWVREFRRDHKMI